MATTQVSSETALTIKLEKKELKMIIKMVEATIRKYEHKLTKIDLKHESVCSHDEMKAIDDEWDMYDHKIYELGEILKCIQEQMKTS